MFSDEEPINLTSSYPRTARLSTGGDYFLRITGSTLHGYHQYTLQHHYHRLAASPVPCPAGWGFSQQFSLWPLRSAPGSLGTYGFLTPPYGLPYGLELKNNPRLCTSLRVKNNPRLCTSLRVYASNIPQEVFSGDSATMWSLTWSNSPKVGQFVSSSCAKGKFIVKKSFDRLGAHC